MKITSAELQTIAVNKEKYPKDNLFEIAFAGKSNVGKSSLINTLVNRKALARTSSRPGKTQTINFYNINKEFRFVDLPGYGYARVSKKEQKKWADMIEEYLHYRKNLIEVIHVIDIRHEPGEHDKSMYEWIKYYGFNGIVVATKADKISRGQWEKHKNIIQNKLGVENKKLIVPFSAQKRTNKDEVWKVIEEILEVNKKQQP
ncbi:ribosome biogenesis GTP-binding protein YihA/YsxC [Anaerosalibacter massiliensis]|uniref:Probable GTP-binding protein EngB n=1 Tax=Anaerosalibacter massiliensis TaxID=1347392 RepID=A0A9X2MGT2_9FIRM|nr:ribosome biogenesis GTP-binding protein YihA/YsxC [Anaerosalibacter massiliensis]MCR2043271.1 ribosome biogenesis GTP-binding protein YihA/YsxC [Anaerosalibacter massiliensis]